jgi:hypothetical protein
MEFSLDYALDVNLAVDDFNLYSLKNNEMADELSGDQIRELKIGYVDKIVSLLVYEIGEFSGVPDLPESYPAIRQDHGFCFETRLEVLKEAE